MESSRPEYWSGLPFSTPGDHPNPGIEPMSLVSPTLAVGLYSTSATWEALGRPRGMVWGGRREEGSGWGTHVYLWRIHFDVWQN